MKQSEEHKEKNLAAMFWSIFEKTGAQIFSVLFQFVLARMLSADEFGNLAVLIVFVNLATTFAQNGFASALVRKQDADDADYSSVFYCNVGLSALFYAILFLVSPAIARFYGEEQLQTALRVLALMLFADSFTYIQNVILTKQLRFREIFFRSTVSTVVAGVAAVAAAACGWGLWALILQYLLKSVLYCLITCLRVRWHPKLSFSLSRIRGLLGFSIRVLIQSLIANLSAELRTLLIGKQYSTDRLAYYDRGQSFPKLFGQGFSGAVSSVLLPILSPLQEDKAALLVQLRKWFALTAFIYYPLMTGLAGVSHSFVAVLLGEKWMESVPFLTVFCFAQLNQPLSMVLQTAFYAVNRSDLTLKLTTFRFCADLLLLLLTLRNGPVGIAVGCLIGNVLFFIAYCIAATKYLGYQIKMYVKDTYKTCIGAALCFVCAWLPSMLPLPRIALLTVQIVCGALGYLLCALILRNEVLMQFVEEIKKRIKK